jgi:hypothetical protein
MSEMADTWMTEPHALALDRFYHALGVVHARWAVAELKLQQIIWFMIGAGPETGGAITFDMGNVARSNLLLTLSREVVKKPEVTEFMEFCVKLFHRNRENRNFLSHCRIMHATNAPPGELAVLQGFRADGKFKFRMYLVDLATLRAVADEIKEMSAFFGAFEHAPEHPASLDRPALPRTLPDRLQSFKPTDQSEAPSSSE